MTLDLEYKGPEGDIPAPATALVDDQNRRFEQLTVGFTIPPGKEIKGGPEDPAWKDMDELGNWFFSSAPDKKTKKAEPELRKLKTGDKFSLFYTFEDPKSPNIKLVFGDVSPVALPPPQEEKKSP